MGENKDMTKTTIQISDSLRQKLKVLAAFKDMSYEDLLEEFVEAELKEIVKRNVVNKK